MWSCWFQGVSAVFSVSGDASIYSQHTQHTNDVYDTIYTTHIICKTSFDGRM